MTGTPHAIASSAARPNDSESEGRSITFATGSTVSTAATFPRKVADPSNPSWRARRSAADRSGPSPIIRRRAGVLRRIRSKAFNTSGTLLTGRKFETWTTAASPSLTSVRAYAEAPSGEYRFGSMKFGIVSIDLRGASSRIVTSVR